MFVDFLSDIRHYLDEKCGVVISDDMLLLHLLWADDLILVSNSASDLQHSLNNLYTYCSKWQLIVNVLKTKVMVFGVKDCSAISFHFNDVLIEIVTEYKYVGAIFGSEGNVFRKYYEYDIGKAMQATHKIQNYCRPLGQVPPSVAVKLFNSLVLPVIEYGSEIWSSNVNTPGLDTFHLKFLKRILKVRQQTPSKAVLSEVGQYSISMRMNLRVFKYWIRVINMPENSLIKKNTLFTLDSFGFHTWAIDVKKLLDVYGQDILWESQSG